MSGIFSVKDRQDTVSLLPGKCCMNIIRISDNGRKKQGTLVRSRKMCFYSTAER